ncbi:MAG: trigger factor [Chloroflexi bacterium]|nr:trigger factor [Chloroflexota bacterium]MQC48395.1 trigger factor [Chloroflexota bacterium]
MQIEVDPAVVEKHKERAIARISRQVRIPGFRPGKATRQVVERHVGSAVVLQEALEDLVPEVYNEALEQEQIEAIDQPEFDLESTDPLIVKAIVPVRPEVDLGDYQSIRVPKETVELKEEQVDEALQALRRQFAVLEPVERAVEWNDNVRADVTVQVEGHPDAHEEEDATFPVREGQVVSLPGFVDHLVGLEVGEHTIEFTLPDDLPSEELADKKATYQVNLKEVRREILPDVDDEFASSLGEEGVETVDQLMERVRTNLQQQFEHEVEEAYHNEVIDLLIARATLDYPEVLVNREIERQIDQASNHASHTQEGLNNWLQAIGRTLDEVRDDFREQADLAVRRALVIGQLISNEQIEIADEDIDGEVDRMIEQMMGPQTEPGNLEAFRSIFNTEEARETTRNQLMTRRAVEIIAEIAGQDEAEAGAAPRASRRRRGATAEAAEQAVDADGGEAETDDAVSDPDAGEDAE